jgi:antitoxin (DNA-binding transcriptional repressor) of toxin-antitoxin stability system
LRGRQETTGHETRNLRVGCPGTALVPGSPISRAGIFGSRGKLEDRRDVPLLFADLQYSYAEAEAASNFASLLARVREGAEIVIEIDALPVAVVRRAESAGPGRLLSESLAIAKARGSNVTLDGNFGSNLEDIINSHREPLTSPEWD